MKNLAKKFIPENEKSPIHSNKTTEQITHCDSTQYQFPPLDFQSLNWETEATFPEEVYLMDFKDLMDGKNLEMFKQTLLGEKILVLKNHGITEDELEKITNVTRKFFNQTEEERKKMIHPTLSRLIRGFSGFNSEHLVAQDYVAERDGIADPILKYSWGPSDNIYPTEEFKQIWDLYFEKSYFIATTILKRIVDVLDLKKDPQWKYMFDGDGTVRYACYPEIENVKNDRFRPHLDIGFITLNNQIPAKNGFLCLEVSNKGKLIAIPPVKNTLVVNFNEHLALFTNGKVQPVLHRVINPVDFGIKDSERTSILFFLHPNENLVTRNPKETGYQRFYSKGFTTKFSDFMQRFLDYM